jgi:hypothetical protein
MGKYAGNERKRFRGAERACTIGENGNVTMCYNGDCKFVRRSVKDSGHIWTSNDALDSK